MAQTIPCWVRVKVFWPIWIIPVRGTLLGLAAMRYTTVPLPVPARPETMVIQGLVFTRVQEQSLEVVTLMVLVAGPLPWRRLEGQTEEEQGAPNWMTVKV